MKLRAYISEAVTVVALCAACVGLSACSDSSSNIFRSAPTYYPTAERNYDYGLKQLKSGNWIDAEQYFQHIKNKFAFTRWATLAELGIADTEMGREKWIEAIDDYKAFIRAHPHHERVEDGYAAYRIGEGHYKQIPSDWFIMPPSYEKDQAPVIDALRELGAYMETYPESPYRGKAEKMHDECVRRLADHELYVANFYLRLNRPHAAIGRLEGVVNKYPGARREPETLLLLGRTYMALDKPLEARRTFVKLAAEHASDYRAEKARLYVAFIDKRFPNLVDGPDKGDPKKRDPNAGLLPPDSGASNPAASSGTPTSPATTSPAPQNNTPPPAGAQ
ncbi:MAG: outer membrane protein assembly factor BamD [Polyangia bacterium]